MNATVNAARVALSRWTTVTRWLGGIVLAAVAMSGFPGAAQAEFGIQPGTLRAEAIDAMGATVTQAAAHPDLTTSFMLRTTLNARGQVVPDGDLRDVRVDLPVGLVGNPLGAARCRPADVGERRCSPEAQVGIVRIFASVIEGFPPVEFLVPLYNVIPEDGEVAQFMFQFGQVYVTLTAKVRSDSDYGITASIRNLPGGLVVFGSEVTMWGVPADRSHDALRFLPHLGTPGDDLGNPLRSNALPVPFFTGPSTCDAVPVTRVSFRSWQNPARWVTEEVASPRPTGCERVAFDPAIELTPELPAAGAPSAYRVRLRFRQNNVANGLGTSPLRTAVVRLPAGVVTSPSSADGLQGCTPEQFALRALEDPTCPSGSKIGTVSFTTPVLERPLTGGIYLAQPTRAQLIRLYLHTRGQGVTVKLAGDVDPDPVTGQLTATFVDNPQLPVELIELTFKGGPRASLSNPRACGPATTTSTLIPWRQGPAATPSSTFHVSRDGAGAPCLANRFEPTFQAGTTNAAAGASSPLVVRFGRDDADQYLRSITTRLPRGVLARVADVTLCGDAAASAGSCPEDSRIGSVLTAAGPGALPLQLPGRVYMTGPYKGAPFGLSIVVPAIAGPFDLGVVVVRAAVHVDPVTTELTVAADPMPSILEGIPLQVRLVEVRVDRDGFSLNPTSCRTGSSTGALTSTDGGTATRTSRFQVAGCAGLPFEPRMRIRVGRRGRTRKNLTTPLSVTLRMPRGAQANLASARVVLPRTLNSRLRVVNRACSLTAFHAGDCGDGAKIGRATAVTPLLRDPLRGDVYFVRSGIRRLPDLMVKLRGQVEIVLAGKVSIPKDLTLGTTFDTVPDAPVTSFRLDLVAGRNGPVGAVENLCSRESKEVSVARLELRGHNGDVVRRNQRMRIAGCPRGGARRTKRAARRARKLARRAHSAAAAAQRRSTR